MKKFKFRLQRVLDYRKLVKDERLRDLLEANYIVDQEKQNLDRLESAQARNAMEQDKAMDSAFVHLRGIYGLWLKDSIEEQRVEVKNAQEKAEKALAAYIDTAKDMKALELLKDRKLTEYRQYLEAEDVKNLDEISVQKGNRFAE